MSISDISTLVVIVGFFAILIIWLAIRDNKSYKGW